MSERVAPSAYSLHAWGTVPWAGVPERRPASPTDDPSVLLRGRARGEIFGRYHPILGVLALAPRLRSRGLVAELAVAPLPALTSLEPIRLRALGTSGALRAGARLPTLQAPGSVDELAVEEERELLGRAGGAGLRGRRGD